MSQLRLVLTTAGSREEAERIAHTLVEERLAACVNLLPGMHSVYRWQGKVETADEVQLLIKTRDEKVDQLCRRVRQLHSYELPELLVLEADIASEAYLNWLHASVD